MSGQEVTDNTRLEIAKELNKIKPPASIEVNYVDLTFTRQLIVLTTLKGAYAPYTYDDRPYHRLQSSTVRMEQHRYEQLLIERGHLKGSWDNLLTLDYDKVGLDEAEIRYTLEQSVERGRIPGEALSDPLPTILTRLHLLREGKLTNAALVLFAQEPFFFYPQCLLKMAYFRGTDKLTDFIDNQRVQGHVLKHHGTSSAFF